MQKAYEFEPWENRPSINTPLNKTNLDRLSRGVSEIDDRVIKLDLTKLPTTEASGMITGITINQDNGDITVTYYSGATSVLHTLLAQVAINFDYDLETERLIIYLKDGTQKYIDLSALITQFEFLDSDTIYWTIGSDGKVKAAIKKGSVTAEMLQPDYLAGSTPAEVRFPASMDMLTWISATWKQTARESCSLLRYIIRDIPEHPHLSWQR